MSAAASLLSWSVYLDRKTCFKIPLHLNRMFKTFILIVFQQAAWQHRTKHTAEIFPETEV